MTDAAATTAETAPGRTPPSWVQWIADQSSSAPPRPRSGIGLWGAPLAVWTVLVAPSAPLVDVALCRALGAQPVIFEPSAIAAALVLAFGVFLLCSGPLADSFRRRAGERRARSRGGAPWWRDLDWPAVSVTQRLYARAPVNLWLGCILSGLFPWALLTQCDWTPARGPISTLPSVVPPAAAVVILAWTAFLRGRRWSSSVVVSWPSLPQFTGGKVTFHVGTTEPSGPRISDVRLVLRCVREEGGGLFGLGRRAVRIWRSEVVLAPELYIGPGAEVRVEFDVPADAPSTSLHGPGAVFWELAVVGHCPLGPLRRVVVAEPVLVPVYRAAST